MITNMLIHERKEPRPPVLSNRI